MISKINNFRYLVKIDKKNINKNKPIKLANIQKKSTIGIFNYSYFPNVHFCGKRNGLDREKILTLDIPNIRFIENDSLRGESLSHKRNIGFISKIKESGIEQVIDLKTSDFSNKFKNKVEANGMTYFHFPIDAEKTPTRDIIDKLPLFFERINKGKFYIACAQGLHRTDIALSINYLFNKNAGDIPPILYGHRRENGLRCDDIFKRCNSIFDNLTCADREKLGLTNYTLEEYKQRKRKLMLFNESK